MKCPECGAENPQDLIQCRECGELLHEVFTQRRPAHGETKPQQQTKTMGAPIDPTAELHSPGAVTSTLKVGSRVDWRARLQGDSSTREILPATLFADRYEILKEVGEGGMGKVYKALDKKLDRIIALKIIRGEGEDEEAVYRFKQELLLARKVSHRNVIRIYDLGEADGVKYFTMDYIEGKSLKEMIRERGKIPADEATSIAEQILAALEEAHHQGVIHRDMKPQNVMVDGQGCAFVMDFGIARAQDTTGVTATGFVLGTPDYMSPEQVRGEKAGPQSDLFSFGVILYEMLTGGLPYQAESPMSQIVMRLTQKPRALRELNVEVPKYLEAIVSKCLDLDRAIRYRSASEVVQDLDRGRVDRSIVLKAQRAVGRNKGVVGAAAMAAVAVLVAVFAVWRPPDPTRQNAAAPSTLVTLAILPLTNATGAPDFDWMRTGIPEMLVTDLGQSRFIRPLPGQRVYNVLEEIGALKEVLFTEETVETLLKRAPAQSALSGQFVESGGKLRFDLTLRRAGAGITVPLRVESTSSDVFGLVDQITRTVKHFLDLTPEQLKGDSDRPIAEVASPSVEAVRSYQMGLVELQGGAPLGAIPLFKAATEKDPDFAVALAKLAEAYVATGQAHEARAAIERAVELSERPDKNLPLAARYQIRATEALIKEDNQKAVESYAELAKLYADDPDVRLSLAAAYEELGRLPEAIEAYKRVIAMASDYRSALQGLGRAQVMSGQSEEAIVFFEGLLKSGRYDGNQEFLGMIHSIIGVAASETGDLEKAKRELDRSLELRLETGDKRGQASVYSNLAEYYDKKADHRKAVEMFDKALGIHRGMGNLEQVSNVLIKRGIGDREAGHPELALERFKESLRIEMEHENHVNMANRLDHIAFTHLLNGQYDEAIVYLEQAKSNIEKTGEKREKAINLEYFGRVRRAQGLFKDALAALLESRTIYEEIHYGAGLGDVHKVLAEVYRDQGLYANALESLNQSLDIVQKLKVVHDVSETKAPLGGLYVILGRFAEAENLLQEAARGHGSHASPTALLNQGELARARGHGDEAAKLFEQAIAAARRMGEKESGVEAQVKLAGVYVGQGHLAEAERVLTPARIEAVRVRLKPVEAEASLVLAELHLAKRNAEAARQAALEAIRIADGYEGFPVFYRGYALLGAALERLGRKAESIDAYARAAERFERIRGGLRTEDVRPFTARPDVQAFLQEATQVLESAGRREAAEPLKKWLRL